MFSGTSTVVEDRDSFTGNVSLGDGDDSFLQLVSARLNWAVDGGTGLDTLMIDSTGGGSVNGSNFIAFERIVQTGTGPVSYAGAFSADTVDLDGSTVKVDAGETVTTIGPKTFTGSEGEETILNDGTIGGSVVLAGGNDLVINNGRIDGSVLLGTGDDSFVEDVGSSVGGTVDGGAGIDLYTVVLGGAKGDAAIPRAIGGNTLDAGRLAGLEILATEGTGTLTLTGAHSFTSVAAAGNLAIAANGSLAAPQITFGSDDNTFTVAGLFTGSIDGGAGTDRLAVSGGSIATPVEFSAITNVEALAMSAGYATVTGSAAVGSVDLTGGRLVGLVGSTVTASQFLVRTGAIFGSAGSINGNLTVAGMLSPGASPGTMTVNGNVTLQPGSLSLFEIAPAAADKLVVNGGVAINSGSTLQIVTSGALRAGTTYDLIVASGGITGSYATILKPSDLFGFIVQRADSISLVAQFLSQSTFSPQVTRSIDYANATLASQPANSPLFAALPSLLASNGDSNSAAFARLTPEAYASFTQQAVRDTLVLTDIARGPAFAATGDDPRAFTFAAGVRGWSQYDGDAPSGVSQARGRIEGVLGGIGYGSEVSSFGAFIGNVQDWVRVHALEATGSSDGIIAGVHGRYYAAGGFGATASIIYRSGDAKTDRALPTGLTSTGHYGVSSWTSDLSVSYDLDFASDWIFRPRAGVSYSRIKRDGVAEAGGGPFALTVAEDQHTAGFADAEVFIGRKPGSKAQFQPFASVGVRAQIDGLQADALAGYSGGSLGLRAFGPLADRWAGMVEGGALVQATSALDLYLTGEAEFGANNAAQSVKAGLRFSF